MFMLGVWVGGCLWAVQEAAWCVLQTAKSKTALIAALFWLCGFCSVYRVCLYTSACILCLCQARHVHMNSSCLWPRPTLLGCLVWVLCSSRRGCLPAVLSWRVQARTCVLALPSALTSQRRVCAAAVTSSIAVHTLCVSGTHCVRLEMRCVSPRCRPA